MGVDSFGRLDRVMPEQFRYFNDRDTFEQQLRSEIVTQGVRAERLDTGLSCKAGKLQVQCVLCGGFYS